MKYLFESSTLKAYKRYNELLKKKQNSNISKSSMNEIVLIDGMNLFIRNFEMVSKSSFNMYGEHIGGMIGSFISLKSIVEKFHPKKVYLIFDGIGGSKYRRSIYENYKNKRRTKTNFRENHIWKSEEEKENYAIRQLQRFIDYTNYLPINVHITQNYEADDGIAYLSKYFENKNINSVILTTDRDFLQLISPNINVYNPVKQKLYNIESFTDEYEMSPKNYLLYKIFEGDKSDNIDGVNGIGLKTFLKLYDVKEKCLTFNDLFVKLDNKSKEKIIYENRDTLERNYKLMQLHESILTNSQQLNLLTFIREKSPILNIKVLQKMMVEDGLIEASKKLSFWYSTFSYLSNSVLDI
jgi:5'-3' exonuclease